MGIQSIERANNILNLFSARRVQIGISEMSREMGLSSPTIHGIVRTLLECGLLHQDPETKKYSLGLKTYELGHIYLGGSKVYQVGAAPAYRLLKQTGLPTRLAMWDKNSVVVLINIFPSSDTFQYFNMGPRVPAYCSAMGKAILASLPNDELSSYLKQTTLTPVTSRTINNKELLFKDLEKTKLRGYSFERGEIVQDIACVGAPIFDSTNHVVASIGLSGHPEIFNSDKLSEVTKELIETAKEISHSLGYHGPIVKF